MRITILVNGTRGDVQPLIALGVGLRRAGHDVSVCTFCIYQDLVRSWELDFAPLGEADPRAWTEQKEVRDFVESGQSRPGVGVTIQSIRKAWHLMDSFLADSWKACQGAEAIIGSLFAVSAYHIAEKLGVPFFEAFLQPYGRSSVFPSTMWIPSGRSIGAAGNWLTHWLTEQVIWQPFRQLINQWRRETLNLPLIPFAGPYKRIWSQRVPRFYGFTPSLFRKPSDWPNWWHVTGFWLLERPSDWQPPAGLVNFLAAGAPPVYIGFGSMHGHEPETWTAVLLEALARAGQRGILESAWGGLRITDLPDGVFAIDDSVPHAWLFPQVAAVVSAGGGTTISGLRAGVPSVTIPQAFEQPFWAKRIAEAGVGPFPIPRQQLSVERVAAAICTAVRNEGMRSRAAVLGERLRAEDGVTRAVELFHDYLDQRGK